MAAASALVVVLLLVSGCSRGPGHVESETILLELDSSAFRPDGNDTMSQTFRVPAITAAVVADGTMTAHHSGAGSEHWVALPFAYQAPDKSAAILTYRYAEGEFHALVVSPVDELRAAIVQRVGGSRIRVVIIN